MYGATNCSVTVNTSGISVKVGNYITTARVSNDGTGSALYVTSADMSVDS